MEYLGIGICAVLITGIICITVIVAKVEKVDAISKIVKTAEHIVDKLEEIFK